MRFGNAGAPPTQAPYVGNIPAYLGQSAPAPAEPPWWAKLTTQALQIWQQRQINKENEKRASQGLPPLTAQQAQSYAPAATVQVGLDPQVRNMLLIGGLAVGGLAIFALTRKRR